MASTTGARSRKRTAKQAIQGDQADIAGLQKQKGQRTKQFQKEAGSIRGATAMSIAQIQGQNLGGLRGTPEGNQLSKEYSGRIKSLRASLPFALAPAQREFKSDIQGINADLSGAALDLQQHQQDRLSAIQDILSARAENQATKKADVDRASKEALRLIHEQTLVNADPKTKADDKGSPVPQSELEWMRFEEHLRGIEGIDDRAARKAVKRLQTAVARENARALKVTPGKYQSSPPLYGG